MNTIHSVRQRLLRATLLACAVGGCFQLQTSSLHAGPFADWWLNHSGTAYSGYPNTGYAPVVPVANAYAGYPNTSYGPVAPAQLAPVTSGYAPLYTSAHSFSLPQANVGVLPTGGYETQYYKAPTTYYRPVTVYDSRLGTNVTTLQPCASYQYQAQRVPQLVHSAHNYAYGGYGSGLPQYRLSPVIQPINPTSQPLANSNVVQLPPQGVGLNYQSAPLQPAISANAVPTDNGVIPAAAWTTATPNGGYIGAGSATAYRPAIVQDRLPAASPLTPYQSGNYQAGPLTSGTLTDGTRIIAVGPPTYSSQSIAIGSGIPQQTSNYAPQSQYPVSQPTYSYPTGPAVNNGFAPSATSNYSNAPVAPITITPIPSSSIPSSVWTNSSINSPVNNSSTSFGPMPGSMGNSTIPSAANGYTEPAPVLNSFDTQSRTAPSLNAPSDYSSAFSSPPTNSSAPVVRREILPQDYTPNVPLSSAPATPRFEMRKVEVSPWQRAIAGNSENQSSRSPSSANSNVEQRSLMNVPGENRDTQNGSPASPNEDANLELKLESLKPIPAPSSFDGSPSWRPVLLQNRDQTAGLPDRNDQGIRTIGNQRVEISRISSNSEMVPAAPKTDWEAASRTVDARRARQNRTAVESSPTEKSNIVFLHQNN